jgi:predicted PurR-regulated permease PerM
MMTAARAKTSQRRIFLALSGVIAISVIVAAREVLLPFVLALVVAYMFTPAVARFEARRVPRWAAILLVYILALGTLSGAVAALVPRLVVEGKTAAAEWPRWSDKVAKTWLPYVDAKIADWTGRPPLHEVTAVPSPSVEHRAPLRLKHREDGSFDVEVDKGVSLRQVREGVWQLDEPEPPQQGISAASILQKGFERAFEYVRTNSVELLRIGQGIVAGVSRGVFTLFMTLMLGGYLMLTRERVLGFFRELFQPSAHASFDRFLRRLDRGLSGVVRGQLLICLVNGVLSAIGFALFELRYWPILAVVAAVMSLIPIFGSILSSVPAVAIGLSQSPGTAFGVLAWIVGIHQLEANFLNPKIIGDSAKIHPVLVVFSLLAGEHFFGIVGALFAVPCMSVAQTVFLHFREVTMGLADPMASALPVSTAEASEPAPSE